MLYPTKQTVATQQELSLESWLWHSKAGAEQHFLLTRVGKQMLTNFTLKNVRFEIYGKKYV